MHISQAKSSQPLVGTLTRRDDKRPTDDLGANPRHRRIQVLRLGGVHFFRN